MADARLIFASLDTDTDGYVTKEELEEAINKVNLVYNYGSAEQDDLDVVFGEIFNIIDTKSDGKVDF